MRRGRPSRGSSLSGGSSLGAFASLVVGLALSVPANAQRGASANVDGSNSAAEGAQGTAESSPATPTPSTGPAPAPAPEPAPAAASAAAPAAEGAAGAVATDQEGDEAAEAA